MPDMMGRGVAVPISIADGGTGSTSASAARTALGLGAAAELGTPIPVASGGTGSTTASGAQSELEVFGNNSFTLDAFCLNAGNYSSPGQALPLGQGNGPTNVVADGVRWESRNSGTNAGGQAGPYAIANGNLMFDSALPWTAWFQFRLDSTLTNYCIYVILCASQQALNTATPQANSLCARYIQGTDTKFTAFGRAASGDPSAGATFGPDVAINLTCMIRMRNVPGDGCYFGFQNGLDLFGDFGVEAKVTTLPASGTLLGWQCQGGAFNAGTARNFLWRRTFIRIGG